MNIKGPDRNPAPCKIQYPLKNQDKDKSIVWCKCYTIS